jgi:hypothetical protein
MRFIARLPRYEAVLIYGTVTRKVTDQRTARDFAACMRDRADIHYPDADHIRVVLDNLSTHTAGALYETFPAPEAHRILQRLEFHYTPKHASWLNMVEIVIGVLRGQCLDRRIGDRAVLNTEVASWQRQRNASSARIKWKFTTQKPSRNLHLHSIPPVHLAHVAPYLGREGRQLAILVPFGELDLHHLLIALGFRRDSGDDSIVAQEDNHEVSKTGTTSGRTPTHHRARLGATSGNVPRRESPLRTR